jgi:hypothetical protein
VYYESPEVAALAGSVYWCGVSWGDFCSYLSALVRKIITLFFIFFPLGLAFVRSFLYCLLAFFLFLLGIRTVQAA